MLLKGVKEYPDGLLDLIFNREEIKYTPQIRENLEKVVNSLPEKSRRLILLRFKDKYLIKEISAVVNLSPSVISHKINHIVSTMRHPIIKTRILGKSKLAENDLDADNEYNLDNFPLKMRTYNVLKRNGIDRLDQIHSIKQLRNLRCVGETSIREIADIANQHGITIE